jgi:excisionase family DNA binding protein
MGSIKENYQLMFTSYPDVVNTNQLKDMLGIGITLAYRLVKQNTIKSIKVGREYKIPKANVIAYLTKQNEI